MTKLIKATFCIAVLILFSYETTRGQTDLGVEQFVFPQALESTYFPLVVNKKPVNILTSRHEDKGVLRAVTDLKDDFCKVTDNKPMPISKIDKQILIIGTVGKSAVIDSLIKKKLIPGNELIGKNEMYLITTVLNPMKGIEKALVIAGSDKRGTIYGIYELSSQIGVSPWYYWADVPVVKKDNLYVKPGKYTDGEPAVRYRGIFLNDEAPALTGWVAATFGGFNHHFYEKVFELILRLKGNLLWPAMWDPQAFYDDDPVNGILANEYGIVIGTTHHEPMGRAHDEWNRYKQNHTDTVWSYASNSKALRKYWTGSMERMKNFETIVTVGMRGNGDMAMVDTTNTKTGNKMNDSIRAKKSNKMNDSIRIKMNDSIKKANDDKKNILLLQKIIKDQRSIITEVTGKKAENTPQVWILYKEVQDYYDNGMRVPDDITLLLSDDNWGNIRKLPDLDAPKRAGGYGMYYHFDYVGGPRNSKWINISPISRVWEQMNLTYQYGVDRIWVVNVGDLKPMEYPISFFLDMAWNPNRFNPDNLKLHTEQWCARQFGEKYAKEAARMINLYSKYNRRITPELLNDTTYSLDNYNEFERVTYDYRDLALDALRLYNLIEPEYKDAFDQLVLFPINACSNLYDMYYAVAKNKYYAEKQDIRANEWADKVKECYDRDSILTIHYNEQITGGKWAHMMDQKRIGYVLWNDTSPRLMPKVKYLTVSPHTPLFIEKDGYVSIEAEHYSRKQDGWNIEWKVIPDMGRTLSGMTTFPVTATPASEDPVYLEYNIQLENEGSFTLEIYLSPTLNFNANKGLSYAVSFDGGKEQIENFNGNYRAELGPWQANAIIESSTKHELTKGTHVLRFRVLNPGIVLQKIVLDTGGLKKSYLGAPESEY